MRRTPPIASTIAQMKPAVFARLQGRIDELAARGKSLVPLHIGDTYRSPPEGARRAVSDLHGSDATLFRYGPTSGLPELRARMASRTKLDVDPEAEILIGNGATHALYCAARAILDDGDEVLVAAPYWPLAPGIFMTCGAVPVEVPLTQELYAGQARLDVDAGSLFASKIGPKTKAIYVISPNNPDGKVLSRRDLESIAKVAVEHDLWVISDEVYADTRFCEGAHVSIAELEGMRDRTVVVHSLSKSHALAGCRVGFVIAPPSVVAAGRRVSTHTAFNVSVAMQRAAIEALDDDAFPRESCEEYRGLRDLAASTLSGSKIAFHLAEGGAYLFLDFSTAFAELGPARPDEAPRIFSLLERAVDRGVLLAPGEAFGDAFPNAARLCFTAVPRGELVVGIERLRDALDAMLSGRR